MAVRYASLHVHATSCSLDGTTDGPAIRCKTTSQKSWIFQTLWHQSCFSLPVPLFPSLCVASLLLAGFFDQFLFLKKQWKSHQLLPLYPSFQNDPYCWNPVARVRFQSTATWAQLHPPTPQPQSQVASRRKERSCYTSIRLHYHPWTCWQLSLSASNWTEVTIRSFWITWWEGT